MNDDPRPAAWALEAIADRPIDEDPRATAARIRRAIEAQIALHFPAAGMRTLEGGESVVLEWTGGPSPDEVVAALGLGFSYELRGAVRAWVDSYDTVGWPEDLDLLTIVLKRLDPGTGRLPPGTQARPLYESEVVRRVDGPERRLP